MSEPPRDPDDDRPRPLIGATFWIMIALSAACVAAGAAVAYLLPRLAG